MGCTPSKAMAQVAPSPTSPSNPPTPSSTKIQAASSQPSETTTALPASTSLRASASIAGKAAAVVSPLPTESTEDSHGKVLQKAKSQQGVFLFYSFSLYSRLPLLAPCMLGARVLLSTQKNLSIYTPPTLTPYLLFLEILIFV
jgi:hypothetical protein